jgi:hypothetical protein
MVSPIVEGFSLSHAAILNGTTGAEEATGDIYGIREGSLEVDTDNYDNTGDDSVLSSWQWFNFATVTVQSGYISFDLYALLSGVTLTTSGSGSAMSVNAPLWNEASLNQPTRPMLIRVPSKSSTGTVRKFDIVLYKVQFAPITFEGPSYKEGMLVSYSGKAVMSSVDEKAAALSDRAIGRLVSETV